MRLVRLVTAAFLSIGLAAGGPGGGPGYLRAALAQSGGPPTHRGCLSFHRVHPEVGANGTLRNGVPAGFKVYPQQSVPDEGLLLNETPVVTGDELADAEVDVDQQAMQPAILLEFNAAGTQKLAAFTRANLGQALAIVIDGHVVSAPLIREPILGGRAQISGSLTKADAHEIAAKLRSKACRGG